MKNTSTKVCKTCKQDLPLDRYHANHAHLQPYCIQCDSARRSEQNRCQPYTYLVEVGGSTYIGQSQNLLKKRLRLHAYKDTPLHQAFRSAGSMRITKYEFADLDQAKALEAEMIQEFWGTPELLNLQRSRFVGDGSVDLKGLATVSTETLHYTQEV